MAAARINRPIPAQHEHRVRELSVERHFAAGGRTVRTRDPIQWRAMWARQRTGSVLCPSCGRLVGVNDAACLNCGRANPGLWGFAPVLRRFGVNLSLADLVVPLCGALFVLSLALSIGNIRMSGLSFLGPSTESLLRLGASGAIPVFGLNRWWTVLSAGWLHVGILHVVVNMMWVRDLAPAVAQLYGPSRLVTIYTAASVVGFTLSSAAGAYLQFLPFASLRGAEVTVGASAAIFGLLGAVVAYGHRTGSSLATGPALQYALMMGFFGFLMPGVDNYAHLGGFAGGYAVGRLMEPARPEHARDWLMAAGCMAATALAIVGSALD